MERVIFELLIEEFSLAHGAGYEPNRGALIGLNKANEKFGNWVRRELELAEVLEVILPYHAHWGDPDKDAVLLVPPEGITLQEAVDRLKTLQDFEATNPTCWQSMQLSADTESPVYLSIEPIDNDDYRMQPSRSEPHLYHIDGLHRLVYWGLQGRYEPEVYEKNPVVAYIAGQ